MPPSITITILSKRANTHQSTLPRPPTHQLPLIRDPENSLARCTDPTFPCFFGVKTLLFLFVPVANHKKGRNFDPCFFCNQLQPIQLPVYPNSDSVYRIVSNIIDKPTKTNSAVAVSFPPLDELPRVNASYTRLLPTDHTHFPTQHPYPPSRHVPSDPSHQNTVSHHQMRYRHQPIAYRPNPKHCLGP